MPSGLFITFEGIDGCGKTTIAQKVATKLIDKYPGRVISTRDPGGTTVAESIRDAIFNYKGLSKEDQLYLFWAARKHLTDNVILPALREGKIVISDRYYDSTIAYQQGGDGIPSHIVANFVDTTKEGITTPDITFFIDTDFNTCMDRISKTNIFDYKDKSFYLNVLNEYKNIHEHNDIRIWKINGDFDLHYVVDSCMAALNTQFEEYLNVI